MEIVLKIIITIIIAAIVLLISKKLEKEDPNKYKTLEDQISKLTVENQFLKAREVDPSKTMSFEVHVDVVKDLKDLIRKHEITIASQTEDLRELLDNHKKVVSQKKSSEVRLGQIAENFMPLFNEFPYDRKKCVFIGNPLDVIYFGEDEIIFLEFKSGNSRLSQKQNKLRQAIIHGKVSFETHRLNENGYIKE